MLLSPTGFSHEFYFLYYVLTFMMLPFPINTYSLIIILEETPYLWCNLEDYKDPLSGISLNNWLKPLITSTSHQVSHAFIAMLPQQGYHTPSWIILGYVLHRLNWICSHPTLIPMSIQAFTHNLLNYLFKVQGYHSNSLHGIQWIF